MYSVGHVDGLKAQFLLKLSPQNNLEINSDMKCALYRPPVHKFSKIVNYPWLCSTRGYEKVDLCVCSVQRAQLSHSSTHGLINYRYKQNAIFTGVYSRVYRLEVQSVMLVFSTPIPPAYVAWRAGTQIGLSYRPAMLGSAL
jgi:hypothetical protein